MKKQSNFFLRTGTATVQVLLIFSALLAWTPPAQAQDVTASYSFDSEHPYRDITVPTGHTYLYLEAKGGDGGLARDKHHGGEGALVTAYAKIGTGPGEIPVGSTLRLIPGQAGGSAGRYGGGGGGSGAALRGTRANDPWQVLIVAGGGGGGGTDAAGRPGTDAVDGKDEFNSAEYKYALEGDDAGPGGGAFSNGMELYGQSGQAGMNNNVPTGGVGGKGSGATYIVRGGFGFGGGGSGIGFTETQNVFGTVTVGNGGGGGGYFGGVFGRSKNGGAGGAGYVNTFWLSLYQAIQFSEAATPNDGYVAYRFTNTSPAVSLRLTKDQTKCIDDYSAATQNGNNIQLYRCQDQPAQQWVVQGSGIRLYQQLNKCLDLSGGNTENGTNIQLWDCRDGSRNQFWIYDVTNQFIRSGVDFNKCLDLTKSNTADGTNIQLWDCNNTDAQKWRIDGIPWAMPATSNNSIRMAFHPDKCVDISQSGTANDTNIQLWDCNGTKAQYFTFNGHVIRMQSLPSKCLDLRGSSDGNGTNIQLYDCNGTKAQQWIYDGFARAFRSAVNTNKCLDVDHSNTNNGTNIQLWDCNGTNAQQFVIGQ